MTPSPLIDVPELLRLQRAESVTIIDCRFDLAAPDAGAAAHREAHVPGAVYADLDRDLSDPGRIGYGRHPLPDGAEFARRLVAWGVRRDRPVICYDDVGGAMASRAWWLLRHAGHADVRLLDGGFPAWIAAGAPVEVGPVAPAAAPATWAWGLMPIIDTPQLTDTLAAGRVCLVDARAPERFRGEVEPLDRVAGHIPGARNRPLTDNLQDGRFRSPEVLRRDWQALLGPMQPAATVHSCGSGVTACHNLFAMTLAGLPGSVLYWPSWSGWIADPDRPVAVGDA